MGKIKLNPEDVLKEGLVDLGICNSRDECGSSEIYDKLYGYIREIERWNRRFNLVKGVGSDLIVRHLLDSLSVYGLLNNECKGLCGVKSDNFSLIDIGSGAGFPGIPLSIVFPAFRVTLLERMEKRVAFLRNIVFDFGLKNVRIVCEDLKNLKENNVFFYDVVTFRAFSRLDKILKMVIPLLKDGGFVMAYKGRLGTLRTEVSSLSIFFRHIEVVSVDVPFLKAERHILIIRKKDYLGGF